MLGHGRSRFPAHAQSCAGQAVGRNLAVTRTLGQIAYREKHPQYSRALAIPLARCLHKIRVTGEARMVKSMKRPFVPGQAGFRAG